MPAPEEFQLSLSLPHFANDAIKRFTELLLEDIARIQLNRDYKPIPKHVLMEQAGVPREKESLARYHAKRVVLNNFSDGEHLYGLHTVKTRGAALDAHIQRIGPDAALQQRRDAIVSAWNSNTTKLRSDGARKALRRAGSKYAWNGVKYGSMFEAASGIMLEQCIPKFSVIPETTFQLPYTAFDGSYMSFVDFLVVRPHEEFLLEAHPIKLMNGAEPIHGDFDSSEEHAAYQHRRAALSPSEQKILDAQMSRTLFGQYAQSRYNELKLTPAAGVRLLVFRDAGGLYEAIMNPQKLRGHYPGSRRSFEQEFSNLEKKVSKAQP